MPQLLHYNLSIRENSIKRMMYKLLLPLLLAKKICTLHNLNQRLYIRTPPEPQ